MRGELFGYFQSQHMNAKMSLPWKKANIFVVWRKLPRQNIFCYANGKPLKVKNISHAQVGVLNWCFSDQNQGSDSWFHSRLSYSSCSRLSPQLLNPLLWVFTLIDKQNGDRQTKAKHTHCWTPADSNSLN